MLDIKLLRTNLNEVADKLKKRGFTLDVNLFAGLEEERKELQTKAQALQAERNSQAKMVGQAKAKGEDINFLLADMNSLGDALKKAEKELCKVQKLLEEFILSIPNVADESVPSGSSEEDNVEIRRYGKPTQFDFIPKDHSALGVNLQLMDFATAAKLSGSRFVVLYGPLARLHRALIQFMLDIHTTEHKYSRY